MTKKYSLIILFLISLSLTTTCGKLSDSANNKSGYGYISAQAIWPETNHSKTGSSGNVSNAPMPATVVTVTMICTGSGMSSMSKDFAASLGQGTIENVPVGEVTLTIEGKDSGGTVLYRGSSSVTVVARQSSEVLVVMEEAPVANAGTDQNVTTGSRVTLNGSSSSGNLLTYTWSFTSVPNGSVATLSNSTVVNPTFTADVSGTYETRLVVTDGSGGNSSDSVTVTASVGNNNSPPVANAGPDQSVTSSTVILDGSGSSDADGDTLTYRWSFSSIPNGSSASLSSSTIVNPTFTADVDGTYELILIVNDGSENSAADTVTITASTTIPTDGLVAYYPFNGNANDESGKGNNGTINGAVLTTDKNGNSSSAYSFDGSGSYINVPNDITLNFTSPISISAWIKINTAQWNPIVVKINAWCYFCPYMLGINSEGKVYFTIQTSGGCSDRPVIEKTLYSNSTLEIDTWYYIVGKYDKNEGKMKIYINSNLDNETNYTDDIGINSEYLAIGAQGDTNGLQAFFNGTIDEVRIYNRALSESEIQAFYNEQ